jgi:pSer/pThr/pTyr-binding forkhead associated (FHA) protein
MKLSFTHGAYAGRDIEIEGVGFKIGRAADNDLRIPERDRGASRHHAEIVRHDGL